MKILLTAFKAFGSDDRNSSQEVVLKLDLDIEGVEIIKVFLPTVYDIEVYKELLMEHKPDVMLLCGQSAGRPTVTVEYQGLNLMYAITPDEKGVLKLGEVIIPEGDNSLLATIPAIDIVEKINDPCLRLSVSAGGYICNLSLYASLYYAKQLGLDTKIGFVHFPLFYGQRDDFMPNVEITKMIEILRKIVLILAGK